VSEGLGRFTEALKRHVVLEVESGRMRQSEARRKYGILGHSTVLKWCCRYGAQTSDARPGGRIEDMNEQEIELLRMQNEIRALKQELEDARFKNIVLETLVDVAERELHIPIRKKYGAKRSGK
jgi:transposase-like protein